MSAGDVLLFHREKFQLFTRLIQLTTRSRWNHAALDLGGGEMVEATSSGVRINPRRSADQILAVLADCRDRANECEGHYSGNDQWEVLNFAVGRVGWRYGYFNAFWCGLRHVIPGAAHIKQGKTIICSELVAEALERAGHDFGKDSALVSPGDLAEHFGVPR